MKNPKKWVTGLAVLLLVGLVFGGMTFAAAGQEGNPPTEVVVSEPSIPAVSMAVRDIKSSAPEQLLNREEINPMRNPGRFMPGMGLPGSNTTAQDPLEALSKVFTGYTPSPIFTFEGLGTDGYTPPDTMGEVGPNHYVQMVNVSFAIYDKSGNVVVGDTPFTDLFAGSGLTYCASQNDGDPVVLWDSMADRWLLSQFAVSSTPEHMCVAISQTADPSGAYYLYEFEVPDFPDYFKFGVWPDAYYMGSNTGYPNQYYAYAFDRVAMLAGQPATYQYYNGLPNFPLPADLDGSTPPPAGTPGYFYTMLAEGYPNHPAGVDRIVLYEFDVDWNTPGNSTFGIAQQIPITDYNYTTCGFFAGDCIPQPDTAQKLDAVDPWPMWRFAYRNLGTYEAMVGNFTVDTNGADHAGIRWFELQKTGATWDLHQEGTHSPDSDHRWMGSIAMDGSGNIALGYSVSSATTYPSLRYASRLRSDTLGTLQAEATLFAGSGSQTGPYDRWGDYSSMSVDPADECTFWYTGEYHDVSDQSYYWNTRIGTFRLPECTGSLGPDFSLAAEPADQAVCAPDDAVYDITINHLSGFSSPVDLSVPNPPTGATVSLVPSTVVTPTTDSVLTLGTTSIAAGSYSIDIVGLSAPTLTHTSTVGLDVYTAVPAVPSLTSPANGATNVALMPTFEWGSVSQAASYYLEVATDEYFTNVVYTATVAVTSHQMSGMNLDPDTPYYWRVSSGNACGDSSASPAFSFTTVLLFCSFPGAPINDNATTYDDLTSGRDQPLADINVTVQLTHTFIGDLDVTLTHQDSGSQVVLLPTSFSCSGDNIDAKFDDEAGAAITCGGSIPALSGDVQPSESLSEFDFESLAGTWEIAVHDGAGGDTGTLVEWCLQPEFAASVGTVVGTVSDANTSDPLAGVTVSLDDGVNTYTAFTNAAGEYSRVAGSGTYTVTASLLNYASAQVTGIVVTDGVTTTQDFVLNAGQLNSSVDSFGGTLELGTEITLPWNLSNTGTDALDFDIRIIDQGYNPGLAPTLGEDVLVVGYDTAAATAMETALNNLGYTYLRVTATEFAATSVADLLTYQAVFHAGNTSDASETKIMAYLDAGGAFYVSDNDLGYFNNTTTFYQTYLQANYVSDDSGINTLVGEDFMAGLSADITADPFPDDFTVAAEGTRILSYTAGNAAGVAVNRNGYKAVYTSFDFDDIASAADEEAFIDAITGFLISGESFWLSTDIDSGTLAIGADQDIVVTLDANEVDLAGHYYADLVVQNSTPYGDRVIPVTMTVTCSTCGTLNGSITDAYTSAPLAASVQITNTSGFDFVIDGSTYSIDLPPDSYYLSVTAPDYLPQSAVVVVTQGVTTTNDFALTPAFAELLYAPAEIEEDMEIGDVVSNTVTVTNAGTIDLDFSVNISNFGGPGSLLVTKVDSNLPALSGRVAREPEPVITSADQCAAYQNYAGREIQGFAKFCKVDTTALEGIELSSVQAPTDIGYAQDIGYISDNFVSFALNNFSGQTVVGTNTNAYYGMDFDPSATTLYALNDTTDQLGTIDLTSGAFTPLVAAPAPVDNWTGLSIDPTNGTFYASTATALYTIEPTTGAYTLVGNFTNTTLMIDIAVGPDGAMYGHGIDTDAIYAIDKATGADTLVGLTGYSANYAQGMDFDNSDGTLYIFLYLGSGANVFGTVDLSTGAVTPLASSNPQGEFEGAIQVAGSGSANWAYTTINNGTVAPGETATFEVVFDATQVQLPGTYTADLNFSGNFNNVVDPMPLTMNISCPTCGTLEGSITDYDTGNPLVADVHVQGGTYDLTVTGDSYQILAPEGTYTLTASASGYLEQSAVVAVVQGGTTITDFALRLDQPIISVSPLSFDVELGLGGVATYSLDIFNNGAAGTDYELRSPLVDAIQDGGFENGTPNAYWDEYSLNFGTPICDEPSCGLGSGTGPHSGTYWTWLGGIASYEEGSVSQDVVIPAGTAQLSFWLEQIVCDSANDYMQVLIDGNEVFVTDGSSASCGVLGYAQVAVDVSAYADGGTHTIEFYSETFATNGDVTNFFVDDVVLDVIVDIPWLSTDPITGTVPADADASVDVIFDTTVLTQTGVYSTYFHVLTNDPVNPDIVIPVRMTVGTPTAEIMLDVTLSTDGTCGTTDTLEVDAGTMVYFCYTVANMGNMMLPNHTISDTVFGEVDTFVYDLMPGTDMAVIYSHTIDAAMAATATWLAEYTDMSMSAVATDDFTITLTTTYLYLPIMTK